MTSRTYYRDDARRVFRIVQQLTPAVFVVVKVFDGHTRTVKFWSGDLASTVTHWSTKLFEPGAQAKRLLDTEFDLTLQEFAQAFDLALSR